MPSVAEKLFALDTALDAAIETLGDQFEGAAGLMAARWSRAAAGVIKQGPRRAARIGTALDDATAQNMRVVGKYLDGFADVSAQATRALKVAGVSPKLGPAEQDALIAYRTLKLAEFEDLARAFTGRVAAAVRKAAVSGQSGAELAFEVDEILLEWVPRARTLLETAIAEFAQVVSHVKSTSAKPQARVYLLTGPIDNRLRPFCRGHVGKVLTRGAIDKLDNGQTPNTFLTRGGYNCRHQWRDVTAIPELAALAGTGAYANEAIGQRVKRALTLPRSSRRAS